MISKPNHNTHSMLPKSHIVALHEADPELFVPLYSRIVQSEYQPFILQREHVDVWRSQTFITANGEINHRQAMPFPPLLNPLTVHPEDPRVKWWFASRSDHCPYPGIKVSTLPNKDSQPWLPACGKVDMLNDSKSTYTIAAHTIMDLVIPLPKEGMLPLPDEEPIVPRLMLPPPMDANNLAHGIITDGLFRIVFSSIFTDDRTKQRGIVAMSIPRSRLITLLVAEGVKAPDVIVNQDESSIRAALVTYRYHVGAAMSLSMMQAILAWYLAYKSRAEIVDILQAHFKQQGRLVLQD